VLKLALILLSFFAHSLSTHAIESQKDRLNTYSTSIKKSENFSWEKVSEIFGLSYFSYFNGPGITSHTFSHNPNQFGLKNDGGLRLINQISFKYKFSRKLALDLQLRNVILVNNCDQHLQNYRYEGVRVGISGKLLYGKDWDLTGSINTDFPYFFPPFLSGFQSQARTTILAPGLFAALRYDPSGSRWFVFAMLQPRVFFYEDLDASESHHQKAGFNAKNKPEIILSAIPTLNYRLTSQLSITFGGNMSYVKQVYSDWNPFNASLISNGDSSAWRLHAISTFLGVTYAISPAIILLPCITTYPIAGQRINRNPNSIEFGKIASLAEVTSLGIWIRGTLF
jgi:hypothetical protein